MPQYGVNTPVRRESYVLLVVYVGEHTLRGEAGPRSVWLGGYTRDAQSYCNLKRAAVSSEYNGGLGCGMTFLYPPPDPAGGPPSSKTRLALLTNML